MKFMSQIKSEVWVAWLGATAVAAVTMTFVMLTFAYAQFETKERAKETRDALDRRLERMENKLDAALQQPYRTPGSKGN